MIGDNFRSLLCCDTAVGNIGAPAWLPGPAADAASPATSESVVPRPRRCFTASVAAGDAAAAQIPRPRRPAYKTATPTLLANEKAELGAAGPGYSGVPTWTRAPMIIMMIELQLEVEPEGTGTVALWRA